MNKKPSRLKKILLFSPVVVSSVSLIFYAYLKTAHASVNKLPPLKNGDIIFQTTQSSQNLVNDPKLELIYSNYGE